MKNMIHGRHMPSEREPATSQVDPPPVPRTCAAHHYCGGCNTHSALNKAPRWPIQPYNFFAYLNWRDGPVN
jgi:hypothetical protein